MKRTLLLTLPLWLLAAPLAAQTVGQGAPATGSTGTGTGAAGSNALNPLGSRSLYPQGTVNPSLMPQPGAGAPATSGSQAIPNPDGGLPSGAATADGQQGTTTAARRSGGGGGLAPGVTPVPSAGGGSSGGSGGSGGGRTTTSSTASSSSSGGRSGSGGGGRASSTSATSGSGSSSSGASSTAAAPIGHASQWVLCPSDDSAIATELGGGMSCTP